MKRAICLILCSGIFLSSGSYVSAATLYMDPNKIELMRGDTSVFSLRLNTDPGECINVVDAVITYTENIEPVDISRGNSILSIWVEEPKINKENRTITFAGGIPNGYCGRIAGDPRLTNNLVDILFMSPGLSIGTTENGNLAKINYGEQTRVLLNDGFGTEAPRQLFGAEITLSPNAGSQVNNEWLDRVEADEIPPEDFTVSLEQTPNAFGGKYFIVFNTTDKQTGLAYYEVIEEPLELINLFSWGAADAPWRETQSPYVLKDQTLNSTIRVRAVDKAGNEYMATLIPDESRRGIPMPYLLIFGAILVLTVGLLTLGYVLIRRFKARKSEDHSSDNDTLEEDEVEE